MDRGFIANDNEVTRDVRGTYDIHQESDERKSQDLHSRGANYYGGIKARTTPSGEIIQERAKDARVIPNVDLGDECGVKEWKQDEKSVGEKVKDAFHDMKEKLVEAGEKITHPFTGSNGDKD